MGLRNEAGKKRGANQSIITILGMSVRQFIGMTLGWGTNSRLEHRQKIGEISSKHGIGSRRRSWDFFNLPSNLTDCG